MRRPSIEPDRFFGDDASAAASDSLLAQAQTCVEDFYRRMFRTWPGAITCQGPGYTLSFSGDASLTGANHLWLHTPAGLSDTALCEAEAFFRAQRALWSVVLIEPLFAAASDWLRQRGYSLRWDAPLLAWDGPLPAAPGTQRAAVMRASTAHHLADVRQVMEEAFLSGSEVSQRVAREEHLGDPEIAHYLVYAGPEAVACATVVRHDSMAGVWNVGTRRGHRRRGYATLLMTTILRDLTAQGCTCSILMASPSGEPLYLKLGYRPIGRICYMGPPDDLSRWWSFA